MTEPLAEADNLPQQITLTELIRFFGNPSRFFWKSASVSACNRGPSPWRNGNRSAWTP